MIWQLSSLTSVSIKLKKKQFFCSSHSNLLFSNYQSEFIIRHVTCTKNKKKRKPLVIKKRALGGKKTKFKKKYINELLLTKLYVENYDLSQKYNSNHGVVLDLVLYWIWSCIRFGVVLDLVLFWIWGCIGFGVVLDLGLYWIWCCIGFGVLLDLVFY